jgi:hypothetical protein
LIASALKPFGNDCVFLFNYNRVNMKLGYEVMNDSVNAFFEAARAERIRAAVRSVRNAQEREQIILSAVEDALKEVRAHSLEFGFRTREGGGASHHLVYATKEVRALNKMKRIYTKASSDQCDGVGSLDYDPRDAGASALLFSPLDEVRQRLLQTFAGRTLTFDELIVAEGPHTTFTDTAYRNALLELEEERGVALEPSAEQRRFQPGGERRTLPGSTRITFPDLKEGN